MWRCRVGVGGWGAGGEFRVARRWRLADDGLAGGVAGWDDDSKCFPSVLSVFGVHCIGVGGSGSLDGIYTFSLCVKHYPF